MGQSAADQLRQVIIPDLIQQVGDVKSQRFSADAVLAYLSRQQLWFDKQTLQSMVDEADFKHEGSLAVGPLVAAIQGRYMAAYTSCSVLQTEIPWICPKAECSKGFA